MTRRAHARLRATLAGSRELRWALLLTVLAVLGAPESRLGAVGRPGVGAIVPDPPAWLHASAGTSGFAAADGAAGAGRAASRPGVFPARRGGAVLTAGLARVTLRRRLVRHLDFRAVDALTRAGYRSWRTTAPPPAPFV